jgi:hypothetical protein
MKAEMIALVDCISHDGSKMGMMLGLKETELEKIFHWVQGLRVPPGATLECVTVVKAHKSKIDSPYVHPPMKSQSGSDGSMRTPKGPVWFELVVSISGEEE